jgi:hypothetical protein
MTVFEGSPVSVASAFTPSQTGAAAPQHRGWSERRQRQREAQAEALASEYERSADSGYEEVRRLPTAILTFSHEAGL